MSQLLHIDREVIVVKNWPLVTKKVTRGSIQVCWFLSSEEIVAREKRALQKLEWITGIQVLAEEQSDDPNIIITHYVDGTPLKSFENRKLFRSQALTILEDINNAGIKKILGTSNDVIIGANWQVNFIDFWHVVFDTDPLPANILWEQYQNLKKRLLFR